MTKISFLLTSFFIALYPNSLFAKDATATYRLTLVNNWNAKDHVSFPSNAHYSPIVAVNHTKKYKLFDIGCLASDAMEELAETGATQKLSLELKIAKNRGHVSSVVQSSAFFPKGVHDDIELIIEVSKRFPLISLATMIAPSPDWIVGVSQFNTIATGRFIDTTVVALHAINAGTEEGDFPGNYSTQNKATSPTQPMNYLEGAPGFAKPFAYLEISRMN